MFLIKRIIINSRLPPLNITVNSLKAVLRLFENEKLPKVFPEAQFEQEAHY